VEAGSVKMDSLTFWGFSDQLSWRKERNPMLYDIVYKPKYAFYGALQMKEYAGFSE
jgi:endo-1,4-beta-xylanase